MRLLPLPGGEKDFLNPLQNSGLQGKSTKYEVYCMQRLCRGDYKLNL
jgi:hypothetical protein